MIREKRITKQPIHFLPTYPEPKKYPSKTPKKHRKLKRCEYKMVPLPVKLQFPLKIMCLSSDVVLVEKDGHISTDVSVLTKFKNFRSIEIKQNQNIKFVSILSEQKEDIKPMSWRKIVKRLETSEYTELNNWGATIKQFSEKYEQFISTNSLPDTVKAEPLLHEEITKKSATKLHSLCQSAPAFYVKLRSVGSSIALTELVFTESLIKELGYPLNSFITNIFEEGIPQISAPDNEAFGPMLNQLLQNFFSLPEDGYTTPKYDLTLIMKSNYLKDVRIQGHFLLTYENGLFGIDSVFTVDNIDTPYLNYRLLPKQTINRDFISDMIAHEKDLSLFLAKYYDTSFSLRYTNLDKVCLIKELTSVKEEIEEE